MKPKHLLKKALWMSFSPGKVMQLAEKYGIMTDMKSTMKKVSDTKTEAKVVLDVDDLRVARQKAVERLSEGVKLQGFRKGKAPASLVEKSLSPNEVANETINIAIQTLMSEVFAEEKYPPIAIEKVEVTKYVPDESAEYTVYAQVLPEVKLGDYHKLKTKPVETQVPDSEVQEIIDRIIEGYAEKKAIKRAAKKGDEVIIDFVGKKDGEAFAGGTAKDYHLTLGSGQFIPGFEDGVVDHEPGDKFDLELSFPEDYHAEDLAGHPVIFEVLLKQVNQVVLPELNDELAAKCGPFKTVDELRADIRKNLEAQANHVNFEKYRDALVKELVEKSKVAAPDILVDDQMRFIRDDITRSATSRGLNFVQYLEQIGQTEAEWEKEARELAVERVKASLILQILAQEEKITATDEEVDAKVAELRDVYQKSKEALASLRKPEVWRDIRNRLIIDKTLDFLVAENSGKPAKKSAKKSKTEEKDEAAEPKPKKTARKSRKTDQE